jgi:hypothetical protein
MISYVDKHQNKYSLVRLKDEESSFMKPGWIE